MSLALASNGPAPVEASGMAPVPLAPDATWAKPNAAATYVMRQTRVGEGDAPVHCHLQVVHDADQSVLWEVDGCFGGVLDPHFLSSDGQRIIVLAAVPAAAGKQAAQWPHSTVAWLFDRGVLVSSAVAAQFVKDGTKVRREVSHFKWLQGVVGVPGVEPHPDDAGDAVELDAIDGTHASLAFSGFKLRPAPRPHTKKKKHHHHH